MYHREPRIVTAFTEGDCYHLAIHLADKYPHMEIWQVSRGAHIFVKDRATGICYDVNGKIVWSRLYDEFFLDTLEQREPHRVRPTDTFILRSRFHPDVSLEEGEEHLMKNLSASERCAFTGRGRGDHVMSTITRSVKSEQAIYKTYRAALTSLRKASYSRDSRSAERRQRARQIVCERYKVSHAIVKDIVARKDQEAGITHEHTPQYLAMLEFQKAREEFEKNPVACHCGSNEIVNVRWDPYEYEIYSQHKLVTSCYGCYLRLKEDI